MRRSTASGYRLGDNRAAGTARRAASRLFMSHVSTPPAVRAFVCLLMIVAVVLLGTSRASADSERERARQHVVDGDALKVSAEKAKAEGDSDAAARLFQESAEQYQAAYDLVPHPLMLYNLAQVYRLAGEAERALQFYEDFLKTDPEGEAADFARKYVKILERKVANAKARDAANEEQDWLPDEEEENEDGEDDFEFDDDEDDEEAGGKGSHAGGSASMRYGGLGLAAAGLASIAVGVKFGLDARNISNCLTNYPNSCDKAYPPGMWNDEALLLQEEGRVAEQRMFILTGVGAALIVGGGVLYYLGGEKSRATDSDRSALRLTPSIDAHSAGWSLAGRF